MAVRATSIDSSSQPQPQTSDAHVALSEPALRRSRAFLQDASLPEPEAYAQVRQVQQLLQGGGYYAARLDGDFGDKSRRAFAAFLRDFPMPIGAQTSVGAQIAWLRSIAQNRFRTPDSVVRQTERVVSSGSGPAPSSPTTVTRVSTQANPAQTLREMPVFVRGEGRESSLMHRLNFPVRNAFDQNYDHSLGYSVVILPETALQYASWAEELERRLPGLPVWSGPLNAPDQATAAATVARTYAQLSRYFAAHHDAARAQTFAQRAVSLLESYARPASNLAISHVSHVHFVNRGGDLPFTGALARIPYDVLRLCHFAGQTLASHGTSTEALVEYVQQQISSGTSAPRPLPAREQIRSALYPQRSTTAELRRVRDVLVSLHLHEQTLERDSNDRVARALFGKGYAQLTTAQQHDADNAQAHTRNLLLTRIDALEQLEQKLATASPLSVEERAQLGVLLQQAQDIDRALSRRRPDFGATEQQMRRIAQ